jgi:hypothetical protein
VRPLRCAVRIMFWSRAAVSAQLSLDRSMVQLRLYWSARTAVDRTGPLRTTPDHN